MKVLLGSTSPRRRDILGAVTPSLEITAPEADETARPGEDPERYALRVSEAKAISVMDRVGPNSPYLVVTCDTIVTLDGNIIGKPENLDHAMAIIGGLSGKTHRVISALSLATGPGGPATESEASSVTFRKLSAREIADYLGKIHYMDKAGAYAVQEWGHLIIDRIEGSLTNVIGFPLRLFFRMAREFDRDGTIYFTHPAAKKLNIS
ncbi:MAG TPA: septum formation protein Maf [Spirochaetes bacterium]|nr:septum formation protein Maf [Spirochaetota bacterium]